MENGTLSTTNTPEKHTSDKGEKKSKAGKYLVRAEADSGPAPEDHAREKLGRMLITAESKPATPKPSEKLAGRQVETLSRAELLALSEKITVEGTTLRQIYETHLVGERGLRRLVAEYLRGGDVKKILRHEIVEHEIDFERDPAMRDLDVPDEPASATDTSSTSNSKETFEKLLEEASAGFGDNASEAATYYRARVAYEAQEQQQSRQKRRLADIGMVATIIILVALVVVLFLTRS